MRGPAATAGGSCRARPSSSQPRLVPRDDLLAGRLDHLGLRAAGAARRLGGVGHVRPGGHRRDRRARPYVAGNLADPGGRGRHGRLVGLRAATAVNVDLVREDVDAAVARLRAARAAPSGGAAGAGGPGVSGS